MDVDAERKIVSNILTQPDRTIILHTHRFVGLEQVDKIYILPKDEIVETGTNSSLLKASGLYANMMNIQNN